MLNNLAFKRMKLLQTHLVRAFSTGDSAIKAFATVNPESMTAKDTKAQNLCGGEWHNTEEWEDLIDPLNGKVMGKIPYTNISETKMFVDSLLSVPKTGLHNPIKNPERYLLYGQVCKKASDLLDDPKVSDFFAKLIQRVVPKSYAQCMGEIVITKRFLENFSGDNVRFLARSFGVPGDRTGQVSQGYRWPYGPVALITPFNFPIEIPALQMMGALFMGNKPIVKVDSKVSLAIEQFVRFLHYCGMPKEDLDLIHCDGPVMEKLLKKAKPRNILFTGSSTVAEHLSKAFSGKVKIEDAGYDWKILGPDVGDVDYVAWQCDEDAYAAIGQKCSAQSILFMHTNWHKEDFLGKLEKQAKRRNLKDLTVGPVLTWDNKSIESHIEKLLELDGAKILWGGERLTGHSIPEMYGSFEPTAVYVPIKHFTTKKKLQLLLTEVFGPFQIITDYKLNQLSKVLKTLEEMENHLTAAVVSNDSDFLQEVLSLTVNGTTYAGRRARTTGAPQNHWFGPAGDPRCAGIGTKEAIQLVWSCHREIIYDKGPVPKQWAGKTEKEFTVPKPT